MKLTTLCERFDDRLRTGEFADVDASANGLQVGPEEAEVEHAAFAVDAAVDTIERAADAGADVLCVHHGLSWGGIERVTGREYERIAALLENGLALYVSHLPLDAHPELGNAAGIADVLSLRRRKPFGSAGGETIGLKGTIKPCSSEDLEGTLTTALDHAGEGVQVLPFGPNLVERVAIVTGAGADFFEEAIEADVDAFVTGEGKGRLFHESKEAGVSVFLAGHYATETFGVRSLQELADGWGLETTFVSAPTGL